MTSAKPRWRLVTTCTQLPQSAVDDLEAMYEADRDVSYTTAARTLGVGVLRGEFPGYAWGREAGLRMKNDYHVSYHRSSFRGRPCVHIVHSAIDYVFQVAA